MWAGSLALAVLAQFREVRRADLDQVRQVRSRVAAAEHGAGGCSSRWSASRRRGWRRRMCWVRRCAVDRRRGWSGATRPRR